MENNGMKRHMVSVLVEDRAGVLQRIAGVFSRRGFNIDTITVGKSERPGLSRMTITIHGSRETLEKIMKQLHKLIETIKVMELDDSNSVVREICLAKVFTKDAAARTEVMNYSDIFRGKVVDVAQNSLMVEVTGDGEKIDAFLELVKPFGIKESVRTGVTALMRD